MNPVPSEFAQADRIGPRASAEARHERWAHLHVNWTAVWVGVLAAFSAALLFGLVGVALGAHLMGPDHRVVDLKKLGIGTLVFSVCGAFFSFAIGGWVAGKVAGILHSEPGMLHGGIVWLVTVPLLVMAAGLGAGSFFGGWYAGLAGAPIWAPAGGAPFVRPGPLGTNPSAEEIALFRTRQAEYDQNVKQWNEDTPKVTRNSALGAVTALLLGLVGGIVGGWMASGEPMNFTHHRTRKPLYHQAV